MLVLVVKSRHCANGLLEEQAPVNDFGKKSSSNTAVRKKKITSLL